MRKLMLLFLVILIAVLSSCGSNGEMDGDYVFFESRITYDFEKATFNNAPNDFFLGETHDYESEFYLMYSIAKSSGDLEQDLTENEQTAFDNFFQKLELLDQHNNNIFVLDSSELKDLFEANSLEIEAIDIFTFNAIKNLFDTLSDNYYSITKTEFLELILDRSLTEIEQESIVYLYDINNEIYEDNILLYSYDDLVVLIENTYNKILSTEELNKLEIAYNIYDNELNVE